jgi:chromosome segregation protein
LYLKNITLRGFKSFAKKSQLIFNRGISVIVGPNGSGKSNIVDAISWVLGSQSAKSLRGTSMDDVIFRSKQEELAVAEVSLLFDNSDKFLPMAFNDIKITRRVFQKGGSEYFINSAPSRLQDIQDITSERGIGKGLYTIINQGQIDDIALLKPVERKVLIDELIGIAKHKIRREKSKTKLVKVKNDVDRINDLMYEVKRTMDPLEIEAMKARKYSEAVNKLKDIEMALFVYDINELNISWEEKNKRYDYLKEKIVELEARIGEITKDKKVFEDDFGNKQKSFEEMKGRIENYRIFENKLESIYGIAESKNNMFKTLSNMLGNEYLSLKNSTELFSDDIRTTGVASNNAQLYIEKLNHIKEKTLSISETVKSFISSRDMKLKFEQDISVIVEEVSGLIDMINKNILKKDGKKNSVSDAEIINKINKTRKEIKNKIGFISKLQGFAEETILNSKSFICILDRFQKSLKMQKKDFLSGFDDVVVDINSYNSKLNGYLKEAGDLGSSKQNKENEIYRLEVQKDQVKEKVKNLTEAIIDTYNLPVEYIFKNYKPPENCNDSRQEVKRLKNEIRQFGTVNPNATIEYKKIKERYDFLEEQRRDLVESKAKLEVLIDEINKRIEDVFNEKFDLINENFNKYFKALFPLGNGEMILINNSKDDDSEFGIDLKVDIGNAKMVPLSLLSGGEKALVSIAFLFSIFATNFSPFYVFDEIDASLDDMNLNRFILLVEKFAEKRQIIIITHQKKTMEIADTIYGVSMQSNSVSKVVSEKVDRKNAKIN